MNMCRRSAANPLPSPGQVLLSWLGGGWLWLVWLWLGWLPSWAAKGCGLCSWRCGVVAFQCATAAAALSVSKLLNSHS